MMGIAPVRVNADNAKAKHQKENWCIPENYQKAPEWFKDAKFGIYFHWGVLSVPAYANDWYARNMHIEGTKENKHQVATYGPLNKFGYQDFVPMFKAHHFNADQWANLFVKAGAKFAGQVAEHHDGFSMWASKINRWNVLDMGPHEDVMAKLSKAIHNRGLKFVTTFHMARNLQIYANNPKAQSDTSYYPYNKNMFTSSTDPKLRMLYGNIPAKQFDKNWLGKLEEVISDYHPDLIYFDGLLTKIPQSYRQEFINYYLKSAAKNNQQVVITHKDDDLPDQVSVRDFERGRPNKLLPYTWMCDETIGIGSWSYVENLPIKPAAEIIHELIDIVSKNGVMMLNISPKADGIIPENQQKVLLEIGNWLHQYGEAIYNTRPWIVFGEGPTRLKKGGAFQSQVKYTPEDIRYTTRPNTIYATMLGWPGANKEMVLTAFAESKIEGNLKIKSISIPGENDSIRWKWKKDGLHIFTPPQMPNSMTTVFKIKTSGKAILKPYYVSHK
jgi:alpha-L-fucosidase